MEIGARLLPAPGGSRAVKNSALRRNVRFPPGETHARSDFRSSAALTTLRNAISERRITSCLRRAICCLQCSSTSCSSVITDTSWRFPLSS